MQKLEGLVIDVKRFDTSYFGNPRYILVLQDDQGYLREVYTKPNSSYGYSATNYYNKRVVIEAKTHYNKLCIETIEIKRKPAEPQKTLFLQGLGDYLVRRGL